VLLIDPTDPVSMYLGHYYRAARQIPDSNVIYLEPRAASYAAHRAFQEPALLGTLAARGLAEHIDYVIIAPVEDFYVPAGGLVSDGCSPVTRFALSSVYTFSFISAGIAAGGLPSSQTNHYFSSGSVALAFDSQTHWNLGSPTASTFAPRYRIGAQLGCTAPLGNTVDELIAMIDRSVAADATHSAGTYYFMRTTDPLRSGPRDPFFAATIQTIAGQGGTGLLLDAVLPIGQTDCLGILTGWAGPDIDGSAFTILPGAFCDHLTSYAGTLDTTSQTKMTRWIAKGASGTYGTVEEPCNYAGKFPHPRVHAYYHQGASLGEAVLRSLQYLPFQGLLYGDPLTRPFADPPAVSVVGWPSGAVSGPLEIFPSAAAAVGQVASLRLVIDGRPRGAEIAPGESFSIDTSELADGLHDVRVVAVDDTPVRNEGRWIGALRTENHGRFATLAVDPLAGDLSTAFVCTAGASGLPDEVQLRANGRVVAAGASPSAWTIPGQVFGAGPVELRVEALYPDGTAALGDPLLLDIAFANPLPGGPGTNAPVAHSYTQRLRGDAPILLELPAIDADGSPLAYSIVAAPATGTLLGSGPHRLFAPAPGSCGSDSFVFTASDGSANSTPATITIEYPEQPFVRGDAGGDGVVDVADAVAILAYLFTGGPPPVPLEAGDVWGDGPVDIADAIGLLLYLFSGGVPPASPFPVAGCP
jgi:hypothetical protein